MTVEQLNSRFGAPGRIVFRKGFAGLPNVVIANQYGTAEVALFGANVLSYRPTGHSPVIFRPAKPDDAYTMEDSFHGGVPVCWPQFGNRFSKELAQHGFARKTLFEVRGTEYTEEKTEIVLGLKSTDETRRVWPHDFDLEYTVSVTMKLNLTLKTKNTGREPFAFSSGFHPYFRVRERDGATVRGLVGLDYFDGVAGKDAHQEGDLAVTSPVDYIYRMTPSPKHAYAILDAGLNRAIALASTGNDCCVTWNPGPAEKPLADFADDDWKKFVCVEPVSDWPGGRTLEPGGEYVLAAAIQAHLEMDKEIC